MGNLKKVGEITLKNREADASNPGYNPSEYMPAHQIEEDKETEETTEHSSEKVSK